MAAPPRILAVNPWGSLCAWLDDDGVTVYLHVGTQDEGGLWSYRSVWVRNIGPAPVAVEIPEGDLAPRLPQPRRSCRHPEGNPLQRGQVMELLWFEEGDGVALLIDGAIEAVLPAWGGQGGLRGYAVEARGRGPFAWELQQPNPLAARVARARAHWDALNFGGLWKQIRDADMAHVEKALGDREYVWEVTPAGEPPRAVGSFRARGGRAPVAYATLGMASQPMPVIEAEDEEYLQHRRVGLVFATVGRSDWVPRILGEMARYPWRAVTYIGDQHVVEVPGIDPEEAPGRFTGALLLADPPPDGEIAAPSLAGQKERGGDPVTWLWVIPLSDEERALVGAEGAPPLVERMRAARLGWVHDPRRPRFV